MFRLLILLGAAGLALSACAERQEFVRYENIPASQLFGPIPANLKENEMPTFDKGKGGKEGPGKLTPAEEKKFQDGIRLTMVNVTPPDGETFVGFTDSRDAKNPVNYYLREGESEGGWTVKKIDAAHAAMTLERTMDDGEVKTFDYKIDGAAGMAASGAGGKAPSGPASAGRPGRPGRPIRMAGRDLLGRGANGAMRSRAALTMGEIRAQKEAAAREKAEKEAAEKAQREEEKENIRAQLADMRENMRRMREEKKAAQEAAEAKEQADREASAAEPAERPEPADEPPPEGESNGEPGNE